ncbi:hypothetical protein OQA88_12628 [Cercophora sp. LCS_1]
MRISTLIALFASGGSIANAAAVSTSLAGSSLSSSGLNILTRRSTEIRVATGDDMANWGTMNPIDALRKLFEGCDASHCDANIPIGTTLVGSGNGNLKSMSLQLKMGSSYPTWVKNGLIDALIAVYGTNGVVQNRPYETVTGGVCFGHNTCSPVERKQTTQFFGPRKMSVRFADGQAFMNFEVSADNGGDGACGLMASLTGAVAGAINGALGALFTLGGAVICD